MNISETSGDETEVHPFIQLMDLLGRRWTLRVLHELHHSPLGFREIASKCGGMSSSVLSTRIAELKSAGIVEQEGGPLYRLTARGRELTAILMQLSFWASGEFQQKR